VLDGKLSSSGVVASKKNLQICTALIVILIVIPSKYLTLIFEFEFIILLNVFGLIKFTIQKKIYLRLRFIQLTLILHPTFLSSSQ
jgi:hypothetical protein